MLDHLAEDEAWHCHGRNSALHELEREEALEPPLFLDARVRDSVEGPFRRNLEAGPSCFPSSFS